MYIHSAPKKSQKSKKYRQKSRKFLKSSRSSLEELYVFWTLFSFTKKKLFIPQDMDI